jgi:outer membrane protein
MSRRDCAGRTRIIQLRVREGAVKRIASLACLVGLCLLSSPAVRPGSAEESRDQPGGSVGGRYEMPERLRRQVAPAPSTPWRSPDLRGYTSELKSAEPSPIDPGKRYDLVELIDVAQRINPETRVAWERSRQAAIAMGLVESEYFPTLSLAAVGGYKSVGSPAPKDVAPSGFFRVDLEQVVPVLNLRWLLLDFGRRGNSWDAAKERLLAANLGFNRRHQEIVFRVQRTFYALTGLRGKIAVAQSSVDSARAVRESAEDRLKNGLATLPEVTLAQQQEVQATFDLEDVLARERDAQVALAESIGVPPTTIIQVTDFAALPPPAALEASVDRVIDRALEQRPDLIARVAALRAKEAEVRRARAGYWPVLALVGDVGTILGQARITGGNKPTGWFSAAEPSYGVGLALEWPLFEGGATRRRVELAEAERRAAEAEVTAARDRAISEVWTAYTDVRLAVRRLDVADALVTTSQNSYEATLESYRLGLGTLIELLAARRELSRARFVGLETKLQLLESSAALAFSTGEPPQDQRPGR